MSEFRTIGKESSRHLEVVSPPLSQGQQQRRQASATAAAATATPGAAGHVGARAGLQECHRSRSVSASSRRVKRRVAQLRTHVANKTAPCHPAWQNAPGADNNATQRRAAHVVHCVNSCPGLQQGRRALPAAGGCGPVEGGVAPESVRGYDGPPVG